MLAAFARALQFLRAFHGAIDHGDHLRAMRAQPVHGPRANQAFENALIELPRLHRFDEFEKSW